MAGRDDAAVEQFLSDGYLRVDGAFSAEAAAAARDVMWRDLPGTPDRPESWTRPSVDLGYYSGGPFAEIARSSRLTAAFDLLAGPGRWRPLSSIGTVMVRFPGTDTLNRYHWHLDICFPGPNSSPGDYGDWRINVRARDRWLLVLMLFSDVGENDAPTRLRVGSHHAMARHLQPAGEAGRSCQLLDDFAADSPEALATGPAGTVYLCHPFLVHAAQPNRGTRPRFIAQPALQPTEQPSLERADGNYAPVEIAIRQALAL